MWNAKSRRDLIIEVWEKLDCENVGRVEIEAIETAVETVFGLSVAETPMKIARILADEGAELRHAEIMELDIIRRTESSELALLSNPLELTDKPTALRTIDEIDRLQKKFLENENKDGVRALRNKIKHAREECLRISGNPNKSSRAKKDASEIAEWLSIWIQSPEIYRTWIKARFPESELAGEEAD